MAGSPKEFIRDKLCYGSVPMALAERILPQWTPHPALPKPPEASPVESVDSSEPCYCSFAQSCLTLVTPWTAARQASLSITNSCPSNRSVHPTSTSKLQLLSIKSVMPSNHLILCHPLLLLPSIFPSIRVFSNELVLHIRWPKYWSFSFSISPSNEHQGLISFRMDWLDLLAVQGTLKSLL